MGKLPLALGVGLAWFLASFASFAWAGAISLIGQLDPNDAQDAFLYQFTLSAPTTVSIQTWGYGGTANAPGGTNAQGTVIPAGGFDPYLSVFNGTGPTATFRGSNDDGACPPGTVSAGNCRDSTLSLVALPAGTYTLALSAFVNMSFAENLGTGTLGDGFIGLGSFGGQTNNYAVDISGTNVVVPTLALSYLPNALTFGAQTLNTTSGPLTVTVTNTGSTPVALGALAVAGTNASEFTTGGDCVGSLGVGASCVINVAFRPTATGLRVAQLSLNSNASGSPALIDLEGTGTAGAQATATLTTTDLGFGNQLVGTPSAAQSLVVTNAGGAPLVIGIDVEGGADPGDFAITDGCAGQTIAPGATCTVTVVFTPAVFGARSATLTFNSNASNNPVMVTLHGNGGVASTAVPTLNTWGLVVLALGIGFVGMRPNPKYRR